MSPHVAVQLKSVNRAICDTWLPWLIEPRRAEMSSRRPRRTFTPEQKSKAVIRHLQDGITASQICDELSIHPNQFYDWKKQALESMAGAFARKAAPQEEKRQRQQVERLQEKLSQKDEVIAELLTEHIKLKKSLGES
jgi:transposase-like protein